MIYYVSKNVDEVQLNHSTMEKEMLAAVFVIKKFRQYILGYKVIVYANHSTIKHLMDKKDGKLRQIRWVFLL